MTTCLRLKPARRGADPARRSDRSRGGRAARGGLAISRSTTPLAVSARTFFALASLALLAGGCAAGRAWKAALAEDSAAGYHRFLREYPDSDYTDAAREHLDFLALRRAPTLATFREFQTRYPQSGLASALQEQLEQVTFEAARATGSAQAYQEFASEFPSSALAPRAEGNAIYLGRIASAPSASALSEFADRHPESDFAAEARRTVAAVEARARVAPIRRVGLLVELPADAPEAARVVEAFRDAAKEAYSVAPAQLVLLASAAQAKSAGVDALLTVRHREQNVATTVTGSVIEKPGVQVTTTVSLGVGDEVAWTRDFAMRVESREHLAGTSVLFGSAGPRFWDEFFLPLATWSSRAAVRAPIDMGARAAAVDARGDRAVALFEDGSFEVVLLADPAEPVSLARYDRKASFEHFEGVALLGDRVAIFGEDGLEVVALAGAEPRATTRWSRGDIGSLTSLEPMGEQVWLGGAKGLLVAPASFASPPRRVLRQAILAIAHTGDLLLAADEDMLLVSTPELLAQGRVLSQLRLGRDFATERIRAFGHTVFVAGKGGVLVLDASDARAPRAIARLLPKRVGSVTDVARVGSRVFLAGDRGVQVLAPTLDRVVDVLDTQAVERVAMLGRHVVGVGGSRLQVVDGLPFAVAPSAAARAAD
ncbi:MAG: hypothetical protein R3E88_20885 [Myxococcota bacterium]